MVDIRDEGYECENHHEHNRLDRRPDPRLSQLTPVIHGG